MKAGVGIKAFYALLAMGLLLLSVGIALADEGTENNATIGETSTAEGLESENETVSEEEVAPFSYPYGAEVRLLQLQKNINGNILAGKDVIDEIKSTNSSADTSSLEDIIEKLGALSDEIEDIINGLNTTNKTSEELARDFVDIKAEAINLTQEFRRTAAPMLKEAQREKIRSRIRERDAQNSAINEQIAQLRREYNAQFLNLTLKKLGLQNDTLIEEVRNGNASRKEVNDYIREALKNTSPQERIKLLMKINEDRKKRAIYALSIREIVLKNRLQRMEARRQNLSERLKLARGSIQNQSARIQQISERILNRSANRNSSIQRNGRR